MQQMWKTGSLETVKADEKKGGKQRKTTTHGER